MTPHLWFRYAHYIYTHALTLIAFAGSFYIIGRVLGKNDR